MIQLNDQQKHAADFTEGTACVVAVPGSGKTLTMTRRIANLVKNHGISPESILGLTFTRNAAKAMREKLRPVLNSQSSRVTLSTIHSFCFTLLKNEGKTFEILQGSEQIRFIRQVMRRLKVKSLPTGLVLSEIGLAKNNLIDADEFRSLYEGDPTLEAIADVYELYEQEKRKKMFMDFNDLLTEAYQMFQADTEVKEKYRQIYHHVLIDEFQDVTPTQMAILNQLIGDGEHSDSSSFWVCGDDWQSIYSFAGASLGNILNFSKTFPKSRQFVLETNYRSTPEILEVCQNLIQHNTKKIDKTLQTANVCGSEVMVIEATNEDDEAVQVVNEIKDLVERSHVQLCDIAVLYRANSQSRVIEEAFSQHDIPYHIENGLNFYQRFEVKTLLDYMRLIVDPESDQGDDALRSVINIPNRYIGRKFMAELEKYADTRDEYYYTALKSMPVNVPYLKRNVKDFIRFIDPLTEDSKDMEPSDLIHILREGLSYDRFITDDDVPSPDDSKIANINQLLMAAGRYRDIESLLNYTETFKEEKSNDKDGVSLMTIHKSKGLEFPVVFVVGFMDSVLPNQCGDLEEERRIAFVGLSRAMTHLYVSYASMYMGRNLKVSPFIDEMFGNTDG